MKSTYSTCSTSKYFPFLEQHFFSMLMTVDDQYFIGTHHKRINRSIFLLQLLKENMWRTVTPETEKTPDNREGWETRRTPIINQKPLHTHECHLP